MEEGAHTVNTSFGPQHQTVNIVVEREYENFLMFLGGRRAVSHPPSLPHESGATPRRMLR